MAGRGVDIKLGGATATKEEYEEVKRLGGLFVLGTERHEARRIDNQLRGRSGRQGDPGATQFYVSLEDSLMRIFATDTIKKMMGRFGIPVDQPIENYLITRSLENAQTKIEGFHFDSRKHTLEYDDVMTFQRKVVYERRRKILLGDDQAVKEVFTEITKEATPEEQGHIEARIQELGEANFYQSLKRLILQTMDLFWVDHLEMMDYMRGSVNLRAYGQRDPLVEYKKEGLKLFKEMQQSIAGEIIHSVPLLSPNIGLDQPVKVVEMHPTPESLTNDVPQQAPQQHTHAQVSTDTDEAGRNEPCPCGSGKKYKKCGMLNTEEHQKLSAK